MSRWRVIVVLALISVPLLTFAAVGSFFLWREGLARWLWWPMAACMILGYLLGWWWQRKQQLLRPVEFVAPLHWTERDNKAWTLVKERAREAAKLPLDQLTEFQFYTDCSRDMALELARFYHPGSKDPLGSLTVPEILAVVELAAHDLAKMVDEYLPGGHLLTVNHWRRAKQATDWYQHINKVYWIVSALFSPVNTGLRYATSQLGMSRPLQLLQENLVAWFATAFIHRLGTYLIDLNSGRLRVGAERYRRLMENATTQQPPAAKSVEGSTASRLTLTVMGQVKAGKSSFINTLLGEQRARSDVLPATDHVTRYEVHPAGVASSLVVLDTVGYGHKGPTEDQVRETEEAARQSDMLVLVMHARNPGREADRKLLQHLHAWFAARPELKMPPIVGILTHIDLLSPTLEWSPPYNWEKPKRPKEQEIREAWQAASLEFQAYLAGVVPACTAPGKGYGISEWFIPTLALLLDEGRAVGLLRSLRAEADTDKVRKILHQLLRAGKQVAQIILQTGQS